MKNKAFILLGACLLFAQIASAQTHRYWRIYVTSQNGANNTVSVNTIMMWDSSGANLIGSGTASASSCYAGCGSGQPYDSSKAFDTDDTSFWNANGTPTSTSPQSIEDDFGAGVSQRGKSLITSALIVTDAAQQSSNSDERVQSVSTKILHF